MRDAVCGGPISVVLKSGHCHVTLNLADIEASMYPAYMTRWMSKGWMPQREWVFRY